MGKTRQHPEPAGGSFAERLTALRTRLYGERGRSAFARDLGVPITTYVHYEAGRPPPAEFLLAVARATHVRLEWLLAGEGPRDQPRSRQPPPSQRDTDAGHLMERIAQLVARRPELLPHVENFLDSLEHEQPGARGSSQIRGSLRTDLIPVVGSTAAGTARFWEELESSTVGPQADARLEEVLAGHSARVAQPAAMSVAAPDAQPQAVALVQYSHPDEHGFLEFLTAASIKDRYPQAVAWRIDGESMSPRFRDGDLVITSADQPPVDSQACVARQRGQIGVNCKLFRADGKDVLLIPVNEAYPTQRIPRKQLAWAARVVASVKLK